MFIVIVRNYKRKALIFSAVLLLWFLMFMVSSHFLSNALICNITINDYLSFSYPFSYEVDNIFVGEYAGSSSIEANFNFKKPLTQKLSDFTSLEGKFGFTYPSSFTLSQKYFAGSDILYHIFFYNKTQTAHGFVQVWNMPYSMEEFLNKSKAASSLKYKYFNTKAVTVNGVPGYYWDYAVLNHDDKYYKGSEVFMQKGGNMYRISYFVPESEWNKAESDIFWSMVNSFKTY